MKLEKSTCMEASRASKLANRHQHCIGDETVKKQVSERFTCPCLTVPGGFISGSFTSEQIHQNKMLHLRNWTDRKDNLKSIMCRTRHVTSRKWNPPSAKEHQKCHDISQCFFQHENRFQHIRTKPYIPK